MKYTHIALIGVIVLVIFFGILFKDTYLVRKPDPVINEPVATTTVVEVPAEKFMSIEDYVTENISEISPTKATMGGTFYVTEISTENGMGVVSYEDGHNAYTADFTYEINNSTGIKITTFIIR